MITIKKRRKKKEKASPRRIMSVEEEFFLVLCPCKVGLLIVSREEDLAAKFRISQSLASRIIVTWTAYTNTDTLKALVGISPSGSICFISDPYGGSIAQSLGNNRKSSFINKLQKRDCGFNTQEVVASKGVKVNVPPFMNPSGQFTEKEMLRIRRIATHRIHV